MRLYHNLTFGLFAALAVLLAAFHSPGQMSVDSVMAMYEGMKGTAVGWGPTFMAATLSWMGGGIVGTSLFVGINCVLTYGCFATLLANREARNVSRWQTSLALVLSLNPLFMFYVGIIWKDVMLATIAMVAATMLLLASEKHGRDRYFLVVLATIAISVLVPIRQQGILIAAPLAIVVAWLVIHKPKRSRLVHAVAFVAFVGIMVTCSAIFYALSADTVRPPSHGSVAVGLYTIQAYDIAGMIADAKPGDPAKWSGASQEVQSDIKAHYSSERIDTVWHLEPVRNYLNSFSAERYMSVWLHGIEHDPMAYLKSRVGAFASLLGLRSIVGCVPAYWGVYGLPEQVSALGLQNEMDARAHIIGHAAQDLYGTPVFRNWFYALLLLVGTAIAAFRTSGETRVTTIGVAVAAWLYLLSFAPTTIACDFRYLYPVAALSTILCIFLLTRTSLQRRQDAANDS